MILYIGNYLSKHGFNPSFIELLAPKLSQYYLVVTASSRHNKIIRMLEMIYVFLRYRTKVRMVLIDTYSTSNFWYAFIMALFCQIFLKPYIPILRGGDLQNRLIHSKFTSNWLFSRAYKNISPSLFLKDTFERRNHKVSYIPNFININDYPIKTRKTFDPKLLFVRSFHQIYHPELAIEILKRLQKVYPQSKLCMVGPDKDGTIQKVKKLIAKYNLQDYVKLPGKLNKPDWIKLSEDYDFFINTSRVDNMPVSVIEAMAVGLPIISTNVGGIPYLIENEKEGLLVEPENSEDFFQKIHYMMENQAHTKEMIQNARRKAESFDWEAIKHQWFKIINELKIKPHIGTIKERAFKT